MIDIELRYIDSCPNREVAEARLKEAIAAEGIEEAISYTLVSSIEDAQRMGFVGSPSILVNGVDPFAPESAQPCFACRVFATEDGPQGSPTVSEIRKALRRSK